jgi:hypothetical protein
MSAIGRLITHVMLSSSIALAAPCEQELRLCDFAFREGQAVIEAQNASIKRLKASNDALRQQAMASPLPAGNGLVWGLLGASMGLLLGLSLTR